MIGSSHPASRHLSDPSQRAPGPRDPTKILLHQRYPRSLPLARPLTRVPLSPRRSPHALAARARRTRSPHAPVSVRIVHSPRATAHHNAPARPTILPADPSCPRGRAHSSPAMPAARPASLTSSTPYTTPAHHSLVHPDLSTLARAGSGTLGHLKRTVRSRRRRSPHTGAYAALNEGIAPLSRGSNC